MTSEVGHLDSEGSTGTCVRCVQAIVKSSSGHEEQLGPNQQEVFQEQEVYMATTSWPCNGPAEEKWVVMKFVLLGLATASLPIKELHHLAGSGNLLMN